MQPLKIESQSTKLLIPTPESNNSYHDVQEQFAHDDEIDDDESEETHFIASDRKNFSFYTSSERT
jgi:hypothetical protein